MYVYACVYTTRLTFSTITPNQLSFFETYVRARITVGVGGRGKKSVRKVAAGPEEATVGRIFNRPPETR